jgi:hypothetical protein
MVNGGALMLKKDSVFIVTKQNLFDAGDAIREKTGDSDLIPIKDMDDAISEIPQGGGDSDLDALLTNTLESLRSNVTLLRNFALAKASNIKSIDFPELLTIGQHAFDEMHLTSVYLPKLTSAGESAFAGCRWMTSVNLPSLTEIGTQAFQGCYALVDVNLPELLKTVNGTFRASGLVEITLPKVTEMHGSTFYQCDKLETADLPVCTKITSGQFYRANNTTAFILRSTAGVCVNEASELFEAASKIAKGTGFIYVPSALIDQYKSATNWARYESSFRALEDYTVDGTTTGALDPNKV